jgi:hypothetical protein
MKKIDLLPGDVFGEYSGNLLAKSIDGIQWLWSTDRQATYNHTGIITGPDGGTFEALWTIKEANLWDKDRLGHQIIVARYNGCSGPKKKGELENIKKYHLGQWYPWWRLFMHVLPPLAKINVFKRPVCSELTARYLYFIGARHGHWAGTRPDTLVDEWNMSKDFEIVFEGPLL